MPELSIAEGFRHSHVMNREQENPIEAIQSSGYKACIVLSGGGSGSIHALLSHPGASRFVCEVQIPYCNRAMTDYLGEALGQFCSEDAAVTMAGRAFERAVMCSLGDDSECPILGIACTAALQTNRDRKGEDRAYICIQARNKQKVHKIEFKTGTRAEQEEELSKAFLETIARFTGVAES
ncbi:MAG: hypothetical protein KJN98_06660 [Pontiella sp.]|nr:hypothetical protein [Pontiella sp.]